ncbi:hypothetical protein RHSIM_Rhsim03G0183000 [Rhododendron simsii]|uniref:Leucine-rich repeat-containing N-terminal plant-type domain-containing protein n=1 Tax=Rhododendron simsii TaxID=118357 RepID=A0A834HAT3_RHOSS|nr:hypothetical protein RHSIM_Rhsim03G0183000 [Rhododendron simsii]
MGCDPVESILVLPKLKPHRPQPPQVLPVEIELCMPSKEDQMSCLGSGSIPTITCIEQERQALLQVKRSLTDTTRWLSSWTGEDCCNWKGIQCDGNTSHVVKLDLVSLDPDAVPIEANEVNPSLLELKYREHLDLSGNNFHNIPIPIFFGSMTSLRYLNLSNSNFGGRVPHHLGNVSNLMVLDLHCMYTESLTIDDFTWVSRLSSLQYLDASGMNLSQALNLNVILNMLPSLTELHLSRCELHSTLLVSHFYLNSTASNIRKLDLRQKSKSYELCIYENRFAMYNLERLILRANRFISGNLPDWLGQFKRLKYLELSSNWFSGSIPQSLGTLSALEELRIYENRLNGTISVSLGQLSSLKILDIHHNQLTGTIPISLGQLSNLMILDLSSNFANLTILEKLSIDSNLLTLKVISPPFQVKSLLMGSCKIGTGFPQWLRTQKKVSRLDISNASISGTLPQWLEEMPLVTLDLSHNHIGGPIQKLPLTLKSLDLSDNSISGPLPQNISEMVPSLETLILWKHTYMDQRLVILQVLRLHKNMFNDNIPSQLCQMLGLQIMDFGNNLLTGPIPRCLGNLSGMISDETVYAKGYGPQWLDTSIMQVIKGREQEFTSLTFVFLANMDLSGNNLVGSIPKEITNLSGLHGLNLSQNKLAGKIPEEIGGLNLSYNNLSGRIPKGDQLQTLPSSNYLGRNSELCGDPLSRKCPDEKSHPPTATGHREEHEEDDSEKVWFYVAIMSGYATGLWGFVGVLVLKKSWRQAYFQFVVMVKDKVLLAIVLGVARLKNYIDQFGG